MEKVKKTLKSNLHLWPEFLIILLCGMLLIWSIGEKKGYHMDELLSFELSNAEFNPWIVPTQPQGRLAKFVEREIRGGSLPETAGNVWDTLTDVLSNRGSSKLLTYQADIYPEPVWIDRETFREYVTVDSKDDFDYLSVYFNVKDDNHPPLHFMLLHTVSSVCKEKIFPMMGCVINLIFVLLTMILMMKLGRACMTLIGCKEQGRITGAGAAALYGLSAGAFSTTLLIRMYAMLTFFCVWLLWVHLKKLYAKRLAEEGILPRESFGFEKKNRLLIAVTVLGFWTQYFFLFYCFALAAVTAILLLRQKRTKELGKYVLSMILAAVIGLIGFPFAISDVFSSGRGVEALENLSSGFGDLALRLKAFLEILGAECGIVCIFVLLLVSLGWGYLKLRGKRMEQGLLPVLLIPVTAYFLLAAKLSPFLVDRYVMPVFPLLILTLAVLACGCLALLFRERVKGFSWILTGVLAVLSVSQLLLPGHTDNEYLYPGYEKQESVARELAELPCICVYEGVGYYENLPEFLQYKKTLLVTLEELKNRTDKQSIEELDKVAVLLKNRECASEVRDAMKQYGLGAETVKFMAEDETGDVLLIYEKDQR